MDAAPLLLGVATESIINSTVVEFLRLIVIAVCVGVLTKFIRLPYTIALVLTGLAIALGGFAGDGAFITHDLVMLIFLPPLLFQAGLHLNLNELRTVSLPVLILALPGVVIKMFIIALTIRLLMPEALGEACELLTRALGGEAERNRALWIAALLFGVVLAPTDPISVVSIFRSVGAPKKLTTIVEGESLFNDGTAVAIFAILAGAVTAALAGNLDADSAERALAIAPFVLSFLKVSLLGTAVGLVLGLIAFWLITFLRDATLETGVTIALCWGAFIVAEHFHASGVIATVVAALIMGNYGRVLHMHERTRTALDGFWNSLDFVVNSILFLLIGFEIRAPEVGGPERLLDPEVLLAAGATFGAILLVRAGVVYGVARVAGRAWPRPWKHVVWWAGLKGSLSIALLLILPPGPLRAFLVPVAFLVVLASLLIQGTTMPLLVKALGVAGTDEPEGAHD